MSGPNNPVTDLSSIIEALLFITNEPVSQAQIATMLRVSPEEMENGLSDLDEKLRLRGIRLQRNGGRLRLTTAPEMGIFVEAFWGLETTSRLSRAALETLAIIAYQQPITRPAIDGIRGVNSDGVIRSLLGKELIQEVGRADGIGRPILYGTTPEFLLYFGMQSISDLPPLFEIITLEGNESDRGLKE